MPLPQHIAIIPDGNRRWAKKNGLPAFFGHREGAKTTEKILKTALELKIPYFTLWGCSIGNITKRDKKEVDFLFKLFETNFKKLTKDKEIHKNEMKINVLGAWRQYFPESTRRIIEEMMEKTKNYRRYQLTFLLAYSGLEEMARAVGEILANPPLPVESPPDGESGSRLPRLAAGLAIGTSGESTVSMTSKMIKNQLYTKDLPPVDLVIRTGGEPHLSAGFMMWDVAEAQLYFSGTYWPAFSTEEFEKALTEYATTERRLGK